MNIRHIILLIAVLTVLLIPAVSATPPSEVILSYDGNAHMLSVTISHATVDPTYHYIKEVAVSLNGNLVNDSHYTSQPTKDTFTYTYPITAQPGDALAATATCSIVGSGTGTLTVTGNTPATQSVPLPTTQKASLSPLPLLGLGVLIFLKRR